MKSMNKLEHAIDELIGQFKEQQELIERLEKEITILKEVAGNSAECLEESKVLRERVASMIETIESLGIKAAD